MSCLKSVCTLLPPLTSGDRGIKQTLKLTLQLYFTVVIIVQLGLDQSITLNLAIISPHTTLTLIRRGWGWGADVEIVVDPGSLAPRNYLSWQK